MAAMIDAPSPPTTGDPLDSRAAAALLAWFAELGISELTQATPRDRFAETAFEAEVRAHRRSTPAAPEPERGAAGAPVLSRAPAPSAAPPALAATGSTFPGYSSHSSGAETIDDARALARGAVTLEELQAALAGFTGCNLRPTAKSLVFGDGAPDAGLMLVGEAPGREEDEAGVPFVGRAGLLLERMLAAIGLERGAVRLANMVPWRPPGNRAPTPAELEICLPFLLRHIELVRPKVLVCLGPRSAKAILNSEENIMRLRGRWFEHAVADGDPLPVTVSLHPDYLISHPAQKRLAWRDLLAVKARLG